MRGLQQNFGPGPFGNGGRPKPVDLLEDIDGLLNRSHSRDGFLGKGKGVGDSADQLVFDVDRAAAHSGEHAGPVQLTSRDPHQNQVSSGLELFQDAQNLDLELLDRIALENGLSVAFLAGPHLLQGIEFAGLGGGGNGQENPCQRALQDGRAAPSSE